MTVPGPRNLRCEPGWQDRGWYAVAVSIATRHADVDNQGHINHVSLLSLYTEARAAFHRTLLDVIEKQPSFELIRARQTTTEYLRTAHYPAPLEVAMRVLRVDDDCYEMAAAMFQETACLSLQHCIVIHWSGRSAEILSQGFRDALALHARPENQR